MDTTRRIIRFISAVIPVALILCGDGFAAAPVVSSVTISRRPDTLLVDIDYTVSDADGDEMTISVVGMDRQNNRTVPMTTLSGDGADGEKITDGDHRITWDAGADWAGNVTDDFEVILTAADITGGKYAVIDISGGPEATNYPVEYVDTLSGLPTVYRTGKIALTRIEAGTYTMGSPTNELGRYSDEAQHDGVLTRAFYMGIYEITQQQWLHVMGDQPSRYNGQMRPVEQVSWATVRGGEWPTGAKAPNSESFVGKLRAKTGILFDLPTETRWEYACRAGTTTALNNGTNLLNTSTDSNLALLGRYSGNTTDARPFFEHTEVGLYQANAWGLHDMHGNVAEWCLDWYAATYETGIVNPPGPSTGTTRVARGGAFNKIARWCRSAGKRISAGQTIVSSDTGFRIVAPVPASGAR